MPSGAKNGGGEGLSLQTLVIAAAASAAAAVIVSHLWKDGTVIAAAMTPVIVAIVKELLARPMESELVRKPVSKIASGSRVVATGAAGLSSRRPSDPGHRTESQPPRTETREAPANGSPPEGLTPMRTYGRASRRPPHLKIAIVTGLLAFAIAAVVLTVPELLFGSAVTSHHSTTLFGGGKSRSERRGSEDKGSSTQPDQTAPTPQQTAPQQPTPQQTTPQQTTPQPTTPQQTTPQQAPPQQSSPVPTMPTPPAP
jgi:hypothetical protein